MRLYKWSLLAPSGAIKRAGRDLSSNLFPAGRIGKYGRRIDPFS